MSRARVHNFSISLDGFATGEGQAADTPFGHAGHRLHEWMFATRFVSRRLFETDVAGTVGVDNAFAERHEHGIGAEIMGAEQVRSPGLAGRPGVERMVGREPAVSHPDVRPDPSPAPADGDGGRHDVPLP